MKKRRWSKSLSNGQPSSLARIKTFSVIFSKRTTASCGDLVEQFIALLISVKVDDESFSLKWFIIIWKSETAVRKDFESRYDLKTFPGAIAFITPA